MGKKSTLNISKSTADKIPYKCCYEELGIIEIKRNVFTRAYEIKKPDGQIQTQFNIQLVRRGMESLLKAVAIEGMSYQFYVRSYRVDTENYLQDILVEKHIMINWM